MSDLSRHLKKEAAFLYVLCNCNPKQYCGLIKNATPNQMRVIGECCLNSIKGRVIYSQTQLRSLRKKRNTIKQLIDKKLAVNKKKRVLLSQSGRGILSVILSPIIGLLSTLFRK